jgi:hypothetical protein
VHAQGLPGKGAGLPRERGARAAAGTRRGAAGSRAGRGRVEPLGRGEPPRARGRTGRAQDVGRGGARGQQGPRMGRTTGRQGACGEEERGRVREREGEGGREKGSSPQGSNSSDNCHQDLGHNGEEREMGERGSCAREN